MTKYIADISSVHEVSEKEKKLLETVWSDDEIKQWLVKQVMGENSDKLTLFVVGVNSDERKGE